MGKGFSSSYRLRPLFLSVAAVFGLGFSVPGYSANKIINTAKHVPGEMVVKLRDSGQNTIQSAVISTLQSKLGSGAILSISPFQTDRTFQVVKIANDAEMGKAIEALKGNSAVEIAEPNYIYQAFDAGLPNDTDFGKLWGMKNTGQADKSGQVGTPGSDINVVPLWQKGFVGSKNIVVAIIDTGVDWNHPDLMPNLYTNSAEIDGDGKDNDGNGFVDDIRGWNFASNNKNSTDDNGHGSHCAGTIGGAGNNGMGVAGVNWDVTIMPIKFLSADGSGSLKGAVESINYATKMKVNVMSNSWGGGGYSESMKVAIEKARDAGILFVAAAGNESNDNDAAPTYPATYQVENVLSVAATDNKDQIASFSNYGKGKVHVAAPGVRIYSSVKGGGYDTFSGTSMACPHVAGISALMLSIHPEWTFTELKDRLIRTSDPVSGLKRKVLAKGRVNAFNAVNGIVPPSSEPDPSLWRDLPMVVESTHPYKENANLTFEVKAPAGAKMIRVHFEKVETENRYDFVSIEGQNGKVEDITGNVTDYTTEYAAGDSLTIRLKSDSSVNGYGFKVDKIQYIE